MTEVLGAAVLELGVNAGPMAAGMASARAQAMRELQSTETALQRRVSAAGRRMSSIGKTMTRTVSLPALAVSGAAVKLAVDFEESMSKIRNLVGSSEKQIDEWSAALLELGPRLGKSPQELADALYFVASSGVAASDALGVVKVSAKGSALGLGETETVADAVTSAMNAYADSHLSAARATEVLLQTVKFGKGEPEELAGAIGRVIPVASQLGISFDDVGASIASLTLQGLDAAEATTALRSIFTTTLRPTAEAEKLLRGVGLSTEEIRTSLAEKGTLETLQMLSERFDGNVESIGALFPNVRALVGAFSLTGGSAKRNAEIFAGMKKDTDDLGEGMRNLRQDGAFQLRQEFAKLKQAGIQIGGTLLPVAVDLAGVVSTLAGAFAAMPTFARDILLGAIVLGPAVRGLGLLAGAIGAVSRALGGLAAAEAAGGAASAGRTAAAGYATSFGLSLRRLLPGAIGAYGLYRVVTGGAGEAGGAAAGTLVGALAGGLPGALIGAGIGSIIGGFLADVGSGNRVERAAEGLGGEIAGAVADGMSKHEPAIRRAARDLGDAVASSAETFDPSELTDRAEASGRSLVDAERLTNDRIMVERSRARRAFLGDVRALKDGYGSLVHAAAEMSPKTRQAWRDLILDMRQAGVLGSREFLRLDGAFERSTAKWNRRIRDAAATTGESAADIRRAIGLMSVKVSKTVNGMVEITGGGLHILTSNVAAALGSMDVKTGPEWKLQHAKQTGGGYGNQALAHGGLVERAKGAIVPGSAPGDNHLLSLNGIPIAKVESGELISVANRTLTATLMRQNAELPRRARGGMVDPAWDPGSEVLNASISGQVGAWAKRYRANMTAGYDPGGGHVSPGHNVTGTATDMVPLAGWSTAATALFERGLRYLVGRGLEVLYGTAGIGTAWPNHGRNNHAHIEWGMDPSVGAMHTRLARVVLEGPAGTLLRLGQAALDATHKAGQDYLDRKTGPSAFGGQPSVDGAFGAIDSAAEFMPFWNRINPAMVAFGRHFGTTIIPRETGNTWDPHIGGPTPGSPNPTHAGWYQFDAPTYEGFGPGSWPEGAWNPASATLAAGNVARREGWAGVQSRWAQTFRQGGIVDPWGSGLAQLAGGGTLHLGAAVRHIAATEDRRRRRRRLHHLTDAINRIGLPATVIDDIGELEGKVDTYADHADAASELASYIETAKSSGYAGTLPDALIDGHDQGYWLTAELDALLALRNRLIAAEALVEKKRAELEKLLKAAERELRHAERQLREIRDQLAAKGRTPNDFEGLSPSGGDVGEWNRQGEKTRAGRMREFLRKGGRMPGDRRFAEDGAILTSRSHPRAFPDPKPAEARISTLSEDVIPALRGQLTRIPAPLADLAHSLSEIEGAGGPQGEVAKLAEPIDPRFGSQSEIFQTQLALADLALPTDAADTSGEDSAEQAMSVADLVAFAEAVRYGAFDTLPYMGAFAGGGVALVGEGGPELAHLPSGTRIHSAEDTAAMLADGGRYEFVVANWDEGRGWFRRVADGRISEADRAGHERYRAGRR